SLRRRLITHLQLSQSLLLKRQRLSAAAAEHPTTHEKSVDVALKKKPDWPRRQLPIIRSKRIAHKKTRLDRVFLCLAFLKRFTTGGFTACQPAPVLPGTDLPPDHNRRPGKWALLRLY